MRPSRFVRFNIVGAAGIGVQLATMWLLVHEVQMHYLMAAPISVGAALLHNFAWHRTWTWRDRLHSRSDIVRSFAGFVLANGAVSLLGTVAVTGALVRGTSVPPVAANAIAIVVCGLVNFWLGDRVVFRQRAIAASR